MSTTNLPTTRVNIAEAAHRTGVSRRTIERWLRTGRLVAVKGSDDRRERLVDLEAVSALVSQSPRTRRDTSVDPMTKERVIGDLPSPSYVGDFSSPSSQDYQDVIDQALQLVYSHIHRVVIRTCPAMFQRQTIKYLREAPLGHDLARLAAIARGDVREPKERVLTAIDAVVQLLFWPAASDDYGVPRSFWDTDLGRMLAMAKYRSYEPSELMSIGKAAQELRVTRPTIYRWMEDRRLNYVRDDTSGRVFVVRRDIENVKRYAAEITIPDELRGKSEGAAEEGRLTRRRPDASLEEA